MSYVLQTAFFFHHMLPRKREPDAAPVNPDEKDAVSWLQRHAHAMKVFVKYTNLHLFSNSAYA